MNKAQLNTEAFHGKELSEELLKDFLLLLEGQPKTYRKSVISLLTKYGLSKKKYSDKKVDKILGKVKELQKIRNAYLLQTGKKLLQIQDLIIKFL